MKQFSLKPNNKRKKKAECEIITIIGCKYNKKRQGKM